ncbi:homogentisate 1,2-dioxygenase [Sphingomonas sp. YL-JM2C]
MRVDHPISLAGTATTKGYMSGFANEFATEAVPCALPAGQNSPQRAPLGLYAEQLSGTAFTMPRAEMRRTWLYRVRPSAAQPAFRSLEHIAIDAGFERASPNRLRWDPHPAPTVATDLIDGLAPIATTCLAPHDGVTAYRYAANRSMERVFYSADGEWLFVPHEGRHRFVTECGVLELGPGEICVIPRGMKFRLELHDDMAKGYICENHGAELRLPDLGPIGSNGLANPRDFLTPVAAFEEKGPTTLVAKFDGALWQTELGHSPLDVVAWHGNNAPYKYDLFRFNAIGTISYDHPDPSIYTVLTSPSAVRGLANVDFVIFPPRWLVAENTFRPPWYHRNLMNELMGLVTGVYDAKADGFVPGGVSLHPRMSAHGPDAQTTERAEAAPLEPHRIEGTMAFMFETHALFRPSAFPGFNATVQPDYDSCWDGLEGRFRRDAR